LNISSCLKLLFQNKFRTFKSAPAIAAKPLCAIPKPKTKHVMTIFQDKTEFTVEDIYSLIANEAEESIHLDFKEANALDKSDSKKKEITKDITAFANSDGGVIIYGLKEFNHKANDISFIDGNVYTKEWLEQTINGSIQRRIQDIQIFPIRNNGNINETIYVVKIPKSYDAPHMSKDKRFYKRFNFESVQMEEYEVRQSYGQKLKSKLCIGYCGLKEIPISEFDKTDTNFKYEFEVGIFNEGDTVESNYKVNVYMNNYSNNFHVTWHQTRNNHDYTIMANRRVKVSAFGLTPIYPDETLNVIRFEIYGYCDDPVQELSLMDIEVKLLYPNGEDNYNYSTKEYFEKLKSIKK
jgi:hypothetical protein